LKYSDVVVRDKDEIRVVTLNRPDSLNSLRTQTLEELEDALASFAKKGGPRALILTGAGDRAFSSGGDIKQMAKMGPPEARNFARVAHGVLKLIETTGKPVLSAVNGLAYGAGCDLAFACDLCVASEGAKFGMTSLNVGVTTPFGGLSRLIQRIGLSRAKYFIYTAQTIDATEAARLGLVQRVVRPSELMNESASFARELLTKAPVAFALSKRFIAKNAGGNGEKADSLEIEFYSKCFETKDQKEGARAFIERRKPVFRGE
jgi:enoyl-CoA hydratase